MTKPVTNHRSSNRRSWGLRAGLAAAALLMLGMASCNTTRQVKQDREDVSGFLRDYSQLQAGEKGQANFVYINPAANWKKYTKVFIRPIELWKSEDPNSTFGKMKPEDQQMLVSYFHTSLVDALKDDMTIADRAGPDTLVVHAALTEGKASKPILNLASTVLPIGLIVSFSKQAITGTGTGVGVVSVEAEFTDGQTGQRLLAAVDQRAGTKALRTKFNGSWGDLKESFDWWANRVDERLKELKAGSHPTDL